MAKMAAGNAFMSSAKDDIAAESGLGEFVEVWTRRSGRCFASSFRVGTVVCWIESIRNADDALRLELGSRSVVRQTHAHRERERERERGRQPLWK